MDGPSHWSRIWGPTAGWPSRARGPPPGSSRSGATGGRRTLPFYFGWGWGADLGGLATQGAPVPADSPARVTYPFKSLDVSGDGRSPAHGRSHLRLLDRRGRPLRAVRRLGRGGPQARRPQIADDLLRGPEAYLQMWERADGVPRPLSQAPRPLPRPGDRRDPSWEERPHAAPERRANRCTAPGPGATASRVAADAIAATAVLTPEGKGRPGREQRSGTPRPWHPPR